MGQPLGQEGFREMIKAGPCGKRRRGYVNLAEQIEEAVEQLQVPDFLQESYPAARGCEPEEEIADGQQPQ